MQNENIGPFVQRAGKASFSFLPQPLSRPGLVFYVLFNVTLPWALNTHEMKTDPPGVGGNTHPMVPLTAPTLRPPSGAEGSSRGHWAGG